MPERKPRKRKKGRQPRKKTLANGTIRWLGYYWDGKRQRSQAFPSRDDAVRWMRRMDTLMEQGRPTTEIACEMTVRQWAERWHANRKAGKDPVGTADMEWQRIRDYFLPRFGSRTVSDLSVHEIRSWKLDLETVVGVRGNALSPKTIKEIFVTCKHLLASAQRSSQADGVAFTSPFAGLERRETPRVQHSGGYEAYPIDEVASLMFDPRIPQDRRVLYAVEFCTGARFGEVSGITWRDWDRSRATHGVLGFTKQYEGRRVKSRNHYAPVHSVLAEILEEWRTSGFCEAMGWHPRPDDPIVPETDRGCKHFGGHRQVRDGHKRMMADCETVGVRFRAQHAARTTLITHATAAGADRFWLLRVTHGQAGDVANTYTNNDWAAMDRAVQCFPVQRPKLATVVRLRAVGDETCDPRVTSAIAEVSDGTENPGVYRGFQEASISAADGTRTPGENDPMSKRRMIVEDRSRQTMAEDVNDSVGHRKVVTQGIDNDLAALVALLNVATSCGDTAGAQAILEDIRILLRLN